MRRSVWTILALLTCASCRDDPDDGLDDVGAACANPDECYSNAERDEIQGDVICLGEVSGGYCTHTCTVDADCCAAPGECDNGLPQVCGPFQSTGMMMCFLSCESQDVGGDPEAYCHEEAHPEFTCRSTGGGSANRKVCVP